MQVDSVCISRSKTPSVLFTVFYITIKDKIVLAFPFSYKQDLFKILRCTCYFTLTSQIYSALLIEALQDASEQDTVPTSAAGWTCYRFCPARKQLQPVLCMVDRGQAQAQTTTTAEKDSIHTISAASVTR